MVMPLYEGKIQKLSCNFLLCSARYASEYLSSANGTICEASLRIVSRLHFVLYLNDPPGIGLYAIFYLEHVTIPDWPRVLIIISFSVVFLKTEYHNNRINFLG